MRAHSSAHAGSVEPTVYAGTSAAGHAPRVAVTIRQSGPSASRTAGSQLAAIESPRITAACGASGSPTAHAVSQPSAVTHAPDSA